MDNLKVFLVTVALLASPAVAVYQDLTWVLDMNHISYWPNPRQTFFKYDIVIAGPYAGNDTFVANNAYTIMEHMGTHIDAPYHFDRNGLTMDKIPLSSLIGPLVKIDISERAERILDANVTVKDLQDWESRNGRTPDQAYVIMSSGWDKYYGTPKYVGTDKEEAAEGDTHYPGIHVDAVKWLLENRNINGIGVDSLRCDPGNVPTPVVHEYLLPRQKICFENLRSVAKVPECGAKIFGLPITMKNSTGAQGRVFAEWFPGIGYMTDCGGKIKKGSAEYSTSAGSVHVVSAIANFLAVIYAAIVF